VNADGTGETRLTNSPGFDGDPSWSPDGTKIAFASDRSGTREIWVMDADGSNPKQLTTAPNLNQNPSWSPDGAKIVFDSDRAGKSNLDVYVMNAEGSDQTRLTDSPALDALPTYSPDGSTILFARNGHLRTITPDGTGSAAIALDTGAGFAYAFAPGWSPDGTHVVFAMYLDTTGHVDIFTAAADGSDVVQLTDTRQEDGFPDWGPHPTVD
jgi:TolB protein